MEVCDDVILAGINQKALCAHYMLMGHAQTPDLYTYYIHNIYQWTQCIDKYALIYSSMYTQSIPQCTQRAAQYTQMHSSLHTICTSIHKTYHSTYSQCIKYHTSGKSPLSIINCVVMPSCRVANSSREDPNAHVPVLRICTCMYVCMYVCICMYMYVYVCICMYMYVYVCTCVCMYVCMDV